MFDDHHIQILPRVQAYRRDAPFLCRMFLSWPPPSVLLEVNIRAETRIFRDNACTGEPLLCEAYNTR